MDNKMKNYIIIALLFLLVLLGFRACATDKWIESKSNHDRHLMDSASLANEITINENKILQREINRLDSIKTPKVELLYQYKYINEYVRIIDTFRQRFTDSNYCKNIEVENIKLWDVYGIDSLLIENYKLISLKKDSIIARDSAMIYICNSAWEREQKERRKSDAKLYGKSFWLQAWRGIAIGAVGVLTVIGLSK